MARAAPPAPSSKTGPAAGFTPCARRFARKPQPSVLLPVMRPSRNTSRFTAPARCALGSTLSQIANAARLCGMVTLRPANPAAARPRTAVAKSSGRTASGT